MTIPGQNILNQALSILGRQSFGYYAFQARETNAVGQDIATYVPPVLLTGSVQPVPRNLYQAYGLDMDRYYVNFYVSQNVLDIDRDISGDQIEFGGKRFQCISKTDWFPQDGWIAMLAVEVPTPSS